MLYTLEDIKKMLSMGQVNGSNIKDVLTTLKDFPFEEIRDILIDIVHNEAVPTMIRDELNDIIVTNDQIIAPEEKEKYQEDIPELEPKQPELQNVTPDTIEDEQVDAVSFPVDEDPLENQALLVGAISGFAVARGLTIVDSEIGNKGDPSISIQLDPKSNAYIDNLLLNMHQAGERNTIKGVDVNLSKVESTGQEMLTIALTDHSLSPEEKKKRSYEMFSQIEELLKNTDENRNYKKEMPAELQNIKNQFHNGEAEIGDNKIVYANVNGENKYYINANHDEASKIAESLGYEAGKNIGGGLTEITSEVVDGSKLEKAAVNVNDVDRLKIDPTKDIFNEYNASIDGIPDPSQIDINYNNRHVTAGQDGIEEINNFFENEEANSMEARPTPDGNSVYVRLNGDSENTVIIPKKAFDNFVVPKAASSFDNFNVINENGANPAYTFSNNEEKQETNAYSNNKQYAKTLGTYPTNQNNYNEESGKTSFAPIIAFILICIIGFLVIYFVF